MSPDEKKRGRPKTDAPRKIMLNLRLTENESNDIQEVADMLNISRREAIMRGITLLKKKSTKK